MKNGIQRFEYFLNKLSQQLADASKAENPAAKLFEIGARNNLFMLEALARMYGKLHNESKFEKLVKQFKSFEDALGGIDYYSGFVEIFSANTAISSEVVDYLRTRQTELTTALNERLLKKDWLKQGDGGRVNKMWRKLKKADWLSEKDEVKAIAGVYDSEIKSIKKFVDKTGLPFTALEEQVHELRRKLRWLSIYPQALQGAVQYGEGKLEESQLQQYFTEAIVHSPFNVFPKADGNAYILLLNKPEFFALSWMIAELGKIKDDGLQIFVLAEALAEVEKLSQQDAKQKAVNIITSSEGRDLEQEILDYASAITTTYMHAGCLDGLVSGLVANDGR